MTDPAEPSVVLQFFRRFPMSFCALAGMAVAASFPPLNFLPGLLGFAILVIAVSSAESTAVAFLRGLAFGFALNLVALYWIAIAFSAETESIALLALPATLLLCLICGLFAACYAAFLYGFGIRSPLALCLGLGACWGIGEWVLGSMLGFPWNPAAIAWSMNEASLQILSLIGTPALSVVTVAAAAAISLTVLSDQMRQQIAGVAVPVLVTTAIFGFGYWRLSVPLPPPTNLELRAVQADIPQKEKWEPSRLRDNFLEQVALSEDPAPEQPRIIIWPESAVPYSLESDEKARTYLRQLAAKANGYVIAGSNHLMQDDDGHWIANNSVYVVDGAGTIVGRYDKVNLVPFGEFLPMRDLLSAIGLKAVAARGDFRPGPGRTTVALPDNVPAFSPLICYEVALPSAATDGTGRARWLLNVTNDAWFGDSSGPWQHLALARSRSVEEGLPLVRAANTGISVVTDSYGRVLAELGIGERGVIDGKLPAALPARPIGGRYGLWMGWAAILSFSCACIFAEFRERGKSTSA